MKKNIKYLFVILTLLFASCRDEDEPDLRQLVTIDGINQWTYMRGSTPALGFARYGMELPGYWGLDVTQHRDSNRLVYDGYHIAVKTEFLENGQYPITLSLADKDFYLVKIWGTDDPGGGNSIFFIDTTTTLTIEDVKDGKIWASFSGSYQRDKTEGKIEGLPLRDFLQKTYK